ncbi:hypothetical protein NliqN6_6626 [Naganishia liquefaciens]|uniref:Uncharacterized protein n=1 Tax=Naganishia liquefaciens TaxID=104408 RepID=A0A8H3U009_9TREE|nr:hypothetical protein NliqN6_6626 [Naganishia liquefaciens]
MPYNKSGEAYQRHLLMAKLHRELAKKEKPKKKAVANPKAGIEKEPMPERRPGQTLNNYAQQCVAVMNRNLGFTGGKSAGRRAREAARRKTVVQKEAEKAEESAQQEDEDEDLENDGPAEQTLKGWLSNAEDKAVNAPANKANTQVGAANAPD